MSKHAIDALCALRGAGPLPAQAFNPGVKDRLYRGGLVEAVLLPSPYKTHKKGTLVFHLKITADGVLVLEGLNRP